MALQIADVFARLGYREDDTGAKRFERRLQALRKDAGSDITAQAGVDVDRRGFDRYEKHLKQAEKHSHDASRSIAGTMKGLGAGIGAGVAVAGAGVLALAKTVKDAAGDINESLSKNKVLFGDYAKDVEKFSNESARQFGISKRAALEYTGTFGNLTRAIGVSQKDSAAIAVRLTKQAADMASFNNTTIEEALDALRSGLVGETEPLRRFGVTLSANSVAAEAMRSGIVKVSKSSYDYRAATFAAEKALQTYNKAVKEHGKNSMEARGASLALEKANQGVAKAAKGGKVELTDQQKQQATLSLITKQTAAAQGDFARTSNQAANQQRIFSARMEDFRAKAGEKVLPIFSKLIKGANDFMDGMTKGTGAGGKFVEILNKVGDGARWAGNAIKDTTKWLRDHEGASRDLVTVLGAVVAGFTAYKIVSSVIGAYKALTAVQWSLNAAMTANPVGLVIAAIAALAAGLVILYKRSETARRIMDAVFGALKTAALGFADANLGMITTFLGGLQKMAEAASHLPGIGGKFKGLAEKLGDVRKTIDGWREGLRKTDDATKDAGAETDRHRDRVKKLRDELIEARKKQNDLKKGTDEYRDAAKKAKDKAKELADAIADQREAARKARPTLGTLKDNITGLGSASSTTAQAVIDDLNAALKGMGAKPINIKVSRRGATGVFGTPDIGGLPQKAIGGIANPAGGAADDHILIDPSGRPVAAMSGTEGILNRPQMGIVDMALQASAMMGLQPYGGLNALWGAGMRHFAGGGQIVPVPGFPGERAAASVIDEILRIARTYHLTLTDAFGPGHKSPGHTKYGTAADFAGSDAAMDRAVAALVRAGYKVLYDGRFGSTAYPGHGPSTVAGGNAHLHVELGGAGSAGGIGMVKVHMPKVSGPAGPLYDLISRSARLETSAANAHLARAFGSMDLGDVGGGAGKFSRQQISDLWVAEGGPATQARVAGAVGLAESGGNPRAVGPQTRWGRAKGLMQILGSVIPGNLFNPVINMRNAVKKYRDAGGWSPWEAFTNGNYRRFLNLGGALRRFNGGGNMSGTHTGKIPAAGASPYSLISGLRRGQGDRIEEFESWMGNLDDAQKRYSIDDRRFGQSTETLIDEKTGAVNQGEVQKRLEELGALWRLRLRMLDYLENARKVARRVAKTYRTIISRLTASLKWAKKKDRAGVRKSISDYKSRLGEWEQKIEDLGWDIEGAKLDRDDIGNEYKAVAGTQAEPRDDGSSSSTSDPSVPDTTTPTAPEPDVDQVARADQAEAAAASLRADLGALRANVAAFASPGDIGAGGAATAWGVLSGGGGRADAAAIAAATGAGIGLAPAVYVDVRSFVPPSGAELARLGQAAAAGLGALSTVPATKEAVG